MSKQIIMVGPGDKVPDNAAYLTTTVFKLEEGTVRERAYTRLYFEVPEKLERHEARSDLGREVEPPPSVEKGYHY